MRHRAALLVLFAAIAVASPAHADTKEAERFFRAGAQAYESGQYEAACRALEHAYGLEPLPAIAFSLAQAYRLRYFADQKPDFLLRAKALYQRYIEATPKGGRRHDAVTALAEIEPMMARIDPNRATVELIKQPTQFLITCPIDPAVVSIDGGEALPLPATIEVVAGAHQLTISSDGYFDLTKSAIAVDGHLIVEEIALVPMPARVRLSGESGAVFVDGQAIGTSPSSAPFEIPAGAHALTVLANGSHRFERNIEVERGQALDVEVELRTTGQRYLAWTVIGGAAVAAAVGVLASIGAVRANHQAQLLDEQRMMTGLTLPELDRYEGAIDDRDAFRAALIGLYTSGILLGLTGALLYLFDQPAL